ncbi:four helix bundle protein [Gemmatimonas sp.]|uniref:four helix bundle protein n=1 Tax=Gemmatimonas sp. TaxID=1962908 RepID=UPI00286B4AB5|nr:four helix bundle protein [Gemmatimonas sp.]
MTDYSIQDPEKLLVYARTHDYAADVRAVLRNEAAVSHRDVQYQLERSSASIHASIAEGCRSGTRPQFARYLQIAIASASESQSHLSFAKRLRAISPDTHDTLAAETIAIRRMLIALQRRVRQQHDLSESTHRRSQK